MYNVIYYNMNGVIGTLETDKQEFNKILNKYKLKYKITITDDKKDTLYYNAEIKEIKEPIGFIIFNNKKEKEKYKTKENIK